MKKEELLAIGVRQYTERQGGNPHSANLFVERVNSIIKDFGEGFAVFVGDRLGAFSADVGGARNTAREFVSYGAKKESVKIKRVKV